MAATALRSLALTSPLLVLAELWIPAADRSCSSATERRFCRRLLRRTAVPPPPPNRHAAAAAAGQWSRLADWGLGVCSGGPGSPVTGARETAERETQTVPPPWLPRCTGDRQRSLSPSAAGCSAGQLVTHVVLRRNFIQSLFSTVLVFFHLQTSERLTTG